ncbi:Hypothetical protein NTJ_15986 [Nesidiocoris tenuis]|uniref:Uncharacterized protein n=1 Tax=Nesidiocoris tenuis TaxID=355587 RepID=A0ABN7BFN7_9HEMI|nr:Hypothetical protein NTJ_15986 [Nesidiocoris tenuis]
MATVADSDQPRKYGRRYEFGRAKNPIHLCIIRYANILTSDAVAGSKIFKSSIHRIIVAKDSRAIDRDTAREDLYTLKKLRCEQKAPIR